jgi:hypothetical protein
MTSMINIDEYDKYDKAQCSDSLVLPHGRCEDDERAAPLSSQCSTDFFPGQGGKSHVGNPSESDEGRPSAKQNAGQVTNVPGLRKKLLMQEAV